MKRHQTQKAPHRVPAIVLFSCLAFGSTQPMQAAPRSGVTIVISAEAGPAEQLAAREVRRYLYLRTGDLAPITSATTGRWPSPPLIVVARHDRPLIGRIAAGANVAGEAGTLSPQEYWLTRSKLPSGDVRWILGGDEAGVLYGAYRFAESLGVRFYLHGDVLPDRPWRGALPGIEERARPLFALRGIQPFHDFPEGPDWWNQDDYLAILSQLPKLRMNFFGLHTYPEGGPNAEPTVWIGLKEDVDTNGRVRFSYPASYQNTRRGNWGYAARNIREFAFGSDQLFAGDAFGAEVMGQSLPQPASVEEANAVFNRTGDLLRAAFEHAHRLGIKTCVGTETPLTIPKALQEHLRARGRNPENPETVQDLYEGMFLRAARAYPLDYYWFWTPENWTWEGTKEKEVASTTNDLFAAIAAAKNVGAPFRLATCGWVLGPQQDRALFDQLLPKDMPVSCINREVGRTPVDQAFAQVRNRPKWAIPWLEDDPALTSPQLWVGRMRRDAADALRYGCDGLMGIHWRTRVLGPAVAALAQAAWQQGEWTNRTSRLTPPLAEAEGPVGGQVSAFPEQAIAGTDEGRVYQTVRYHLASYRLRAANGTCKVTLKFCEPYYSMAGMRVFDVKLQGRTVLEQLDIFARAGRNRALDFTYPDIAVTNGWLNLEFIPRVEFPSIAGIVVESAGAIRRIDCGGPGWGDYVADLPALPAPLLEFPATDDFYGDWAWHEFGPDAGNPAAAIFRRIDGRLPRPSDWVNGPGGLKPDPRPWSALREDYAFVDELATLRGVPRGVGERARLEYWLETFAYMRSMAEVNCTSWLFTNALGRVKADVDASRRRERAEREVLPIRRRLVQQVAQVYAHLLATVSTPGELGTVANWEQHILPGLLEKPGAELAQLLGHSLPADAQPQLSYRGPTRVILPTLRTSVAAGESLKLKVIILAAVPPRSTSLHWRELGKGKFSQQPLQHVGRGVYEVSLPPATHDLEYFIKVVSADAGTKHFPVTAPAQNQTLVLFPK